MKMISPAPATASLIHITDLPFVCFVLVMFHMKHKNKR
jgi:hypothetical protein